MSGAPIAVIGSGASGLFQALFLAKIRKKQVVIIEQASVIGGIFGSENSPFGPIDHGAFLLQESGCPALDDLFFDVLPPDQWHIYEGVRRDISGNYFRGHLDQGSLYADLRRLPYAESSTAWAEIVERSKAPVLDFAEAPSLAAYVESRFGPTVAKEIMTPLALKTWRKQPEELSSWAAKFLHLTRVVAHTPDETLRLKQDPSLDRVLGFPEQLAFPEARLSHHRRALYPRQFGLKTVLTGLAEALARHDVRTMTLTKVKAVVRSGDDVRALTLENPEGTYDLPVSGVLWTTAIPAALSLFDDRKLSLPDPPLAHRIVYLFLDRPPATGPLYWFWSFDPETTWVRVSVPGAYCPAAASSGRIPLCIEAHVPSPAISDDEAIGRVRTEMEQCGLIAAGTRITGGYTLKAMRAYPVPSLANYKVMREARKALDTLLPRNMHISAQDPSAGVFFLPDILRTSAPILEHL